MTHRINGEKSGTDNLGFVNAKELGGNGVRQKGQGLLAATREDSQGRQI